MNRFSAVTVQNGGSPTSECRQAARPSVPSPVDPLPPTVPTSVDWASPGSTVDAPRVRSAPTIFDEPPRPTRALVASPVSRLQPRTVGQLLDGGFEVLRFRFRTITIIAATIVLPLYALPQALVAALGGVRDVDLFGGSSPLGYLAQLGLWVATMLLGVAIGFLVSGWLVGADPTPADTFRFLRSRLVVALGAFVVALLLKVAGLVACGVGILFVVPVLSVLAPVVAAEGLGIVESVRRTIALARRRIGAVFGVGLLWALSSWLVSAAAAGAAAVVGELATGSTDGADIAVQAVNVVGTVVLTVVQVAVTVLVYVDLRVRTEGLDLELESMERFRAAA